MLVWADSQIYVVYIKLCPIDIKIDVMNLQDKWELKIGHTT